MGWGYLVGSWNYVASSGSSTAEGASDVSPSHLFHPFPGTCRWLSLCGCLVWGLVCFAFCFPPFVCFVLQVQRIPISHFSQVLDDRQCFIARLARQKKKRKHHQPDWRKECSCRQRPSHPNKYCWCRVGFHHLNFEL